MFLFFVQPYWALKVSLQDWLITNIIEMNKVQFGLKSYAWFQHRTGAQREFHLKSRVWFQTKIVRHRVQLPLYYIHFQWKRKIQSLKYRIFQLFCTNILLIQYWAGLWKVAKVVFHFPETWLVTSKKPWNLIGCRSLVKLSRWLRKKMWLRG